MGAELPTGTVTFLFTDLEGSTRLWEANSEEMKGALARHDEILREAVEAQGGVVVKTTGDGLHAVFASADSAARASAAAQQAFAGERWGETGPLRVRMGLHTGEAEARGGDYYGPVLNRAARLTAAAHGGQILVSQATEALLRDHVGEDVVLVDLGEHRLRDLSRPEGVFQLAAAGLMTEFPPLRSLEARAGNLPRQVTSFVGRVEELARLRRALGERSLVTLTGVGGVGKTRLALRAAAEVIGEFPDGVWLCEFAAVTDPEAVGEALAASLGVKPVPGQVLMETVLEYLTVKRVLLVLDNCEHLLGAVARLVDQIAHRCPQVVVLVTSREGLGVAGEQMVAVPSLRLPDAHMPVEQLGHSDAVCLFVERARDAKSDFSLTPQNATAVVQLCRRLDGIPLALELAAARVRSLTPDDLVARLDQRFKLLTRGSRAALERHQTLRNTIDWSYELLEPTERETLQGASVFAGGCDLSAAEAVLTGDSLDRLDVADLLGQLVDKSLVGIDDHRPRTRFGMLETIRQYAQERLEESGAAPRVRQRHAEYYRRLVESAGPHLRGSNQLDWAQDLSAEVDNLRVALDWAVEQNDVDGALRLVAPLAISGVEVGDAAMDWADTAAGIPGADRHPLFEVVASWAAFGAALHGEPERARAVLQRVDAAEEAPGARSVVACRAAAVLAFFTGDLDAARTKSDEWVAVARATGDPYEVSQALVMQGNAIQLLDLEASIRTLEEAVQTAREAGIPSALAIALSCLAAGLVLRDPLPPTVAQRAIRLAEEAIEVGTTIGDRTSVGVAIGIKGFIGERRGDWRLQLESCVEAADLALELGSPQQLAPRLGGAAWALAHFGAFESAAILQSASETLWGGRWGIPDIILAQIAEFDTTLLEQLGAERLSELQAHGAALGLAEVVEYLRVEATRVLTTA